MQVKLKLFAGYRRYLPEDGQGTARDLEVETDTSVHDLLSMLNVPIEGSVMLVNGRMAAPEQVLEEGDVVAAFPALAGG